jgi:DNA-binding transcriptional MerR regulator
MRLAELAARSGLSTATIKYYLRSGLLHPGEAQSSTWADYDEGHLRRLRLVRALTEVAGLPLEKVRQVVLAVDEAGSEHQARGAAQWALSQVPGEEPSPAALHRVDELLARHGWQVHVDSPHRRMLAAAIDTVDRLGMPATDEILDSYARALRPVAELEVGRVAAAGDATVAAERLVVGTLLYEPLLTTLRRMAHEAVSAAPQPRARKKGDPATA